ncbi:MAG TPA: tRNA (N6-threonylcarbamoyladenosine(37)-N6)-methyltransferase TrmO [Streptosporangiaceae bacterium]|nr:tRNA (N6-threonylcarbamoyladenosine(37)-N6)-methyltransferase TrmO [Streptosporangiaceae bacterium]
MSRLGDSMTPPELALRLPVIGVVRASHHELETTPIQAGLNRAEHGTIEIAEPYRDGLDGLGSFDYAWLLSWLHRPRDPDGPAPLRQVPFLLRRRQRRMGVFATRSPRRVNPIGLSLIQLLEVTSHAVVFAGVDLMDGTPVIDLKPYVTRFDRPPGKPRCGWYDEITITDGTTPGQLAQP